MSTKTTPSQEPHTLTLIKEALKDAKLDPEGDERIKGNSGPFKKELTLLLRRFGMPQDDSAAREILGRDYLSPEEIADARGISYSAEQMGRHGELPAVDVLIWCRRNNYMLTAGPPDQMSMPGLEQSFFRRKEDCWRACTHERFLHQDTVSCRWLMLSKDHVKCSLGKPLLKQLKLLSDLERIPNAAEQVWGMTTYKAVRGEYLLQGLIVRTSSVLSYGHNVCVGDFDEDGIFVAPCCRGTEVHYLGLASARQS